MLIILLLECRAVDDVHCGVVRVEVPRDQAIRYGLAWEVGKDFGFVIQPRCFEQKGAGGLVLLGRLDLLVLLIDLLLVVGEIVLDLGDLGVRVSGGATAAWIGAVLTLARMAYQCASEAK